MEDILFGKSKSTEDLINNVKKELDSLPRLSGNRCIYRVPKRIRSMNEKAYTPQVVSIGPLHHGAEGLKSMEEHKMRFLRDYLKRIEKDLEYYVSIVKNQEEKLRSFYAEHIGFSSDEFVKIILVDAVFIIQLMLKPLDPNINEPNYVWERPWMGDDIKYDLLLLENQLPLFILKDLYDPKPVTYDDGMTLSFASLSKLIFPNLLDPEPSKTDLVNHLINSNEDNLSNHLIELLIKSGVPENQQFGALAEGKALSLPTVTKLHQAGVKFEVSKGKKLLDIQFSNGVLQIPKLKIVDETEAQIRNLIAFEQCHYHQENRCVSDYAVLMDSLVDKSEDVELLVKFGIIENRIGDNNRVATLINKLGDGIIWNQKKFMFAEIYRQLIEHYNVPCNKRKANLKQNYFNSLWTTLSVIAASLLLILTIIQTVCSIISVVKG